MKSNDCFICLNPSNNKVCHTCTCCAHFSCWGKYILKNNTDICCLTVPYGLILLYNYSIPCPICKTPIYQLPPLTRSRTEYLRFNGYMLEINDMISNINEDIHVHERIERRHCLFKYLKNMKGFIKAIPEMTSVIKDNLYELYYEENWKIANQYHIDLFGEQIQYKK